MKKPSQKRKKKSIRRREQEPAEQAKLSQTSDGPGSEKKIPVKKEVPAVQKKEPERKGEKKDSIFRYVQISVQFLRESKIELKKVKWPTRKELLASTAMVIFLVLVVSFFLGLIDFGLIKIIKTIAG